MNSRQLNVKTLFREVDLTKSNFEKINNALPKFYMAAETVNDLFHQLITNKLDLDNATDR
jgi:hypothetical protein